nr:hypothetical protein CFP56_11294 [Quercus suber]
MKWETQGEFADLRYHDKDVESSFGISGVRVMVELKNLENKQKTVWVSTGARRVYRAARRQGDLNRPDRLCMGMRG